MLWVKPAVFRAIQFLFPGRVELVRMSLVHHHVTSSAL
jgi:hypothetical protein